MPFYIFVAANLEKIHSSMLSCQQRELVVVHGESVLLAGEGLPHDGVNLQVPGVETGDHVSLNRRDPAEEDLLHSSPLPAELGDNLPVRGDGDTKLQVRGI